MKSTVIQTAHFPADTMRPVASVNRNKPMQKLPVIFALASLWASLAPANAMVMDNDFPVLLPESETMNEPFTLSSVPTLRAENAPPVSPAAYLRSGWQARLSTRAHGVRGTVTIVDADTFRVDNFFYDGGGINVHFILAAGDDNITYRDARLVTDLNLLGMPHSGDSITVDLPSGTTFDGYNAISLWCIPAQANFGSGTFASPLPEPTASGMLAFGMIAFGLFVRRR